MRLSDLVTFRQDLLFQGAVQVGWFETDASKCCKAAEHFVFHGPAYHGVSQRDFSAASTYRLKDTAGFMRDVIANLLENGDHDSPIMIAAAGYGTGKSHLGLTLSTLLAKPNGSSAKRVIANLQSTDKVIGSHVDGLLSGLETPYLVLPINGMKDFDLVEEIRRQVLSNLARRGINSAPLEELRPRFRVAQNFTSSFFEPLKSDFTKRFGDGCTIDGIRSLLAAQDEETFRSISEIYEQKMGDSIRAVGQESLQSFLTVLRQNYCGPGKIFRGMVIVFDEFGRFLEFAVQKPHIAGRDGLQQLFEGVQDNSESMFLLCFVQSELKAYASRMAPELRDSLDRFITRYDSAPKVRLSTNLETIIANLLQKGDPDRIDELLQARVRQGGPDALLPKLRKWFPEMEKHALWKDTERFAQVVQKGCWPLHPTSTWLLYHLSSVGKSLQQRSAMTFLEDAIQANENREINREYWAIYPVDLCNDYMVTEFLNSERYGQQGAVAHAYESALSRYQHEFTPTEKTILKAVLLGVKMGLRVASERDFGEALALLGGLTQADVQAALKKLSREHGVLEWNEATRQYDIVGDALPRRAFISFLNDHVRQIDQNQRAALFAQNIKKWCDLNLIETDFGAKNQITTAEWHYSVTCSNVQLIESHIEFAFRAWVDGTAVDECRGQAIYCYVGRESDFSRVRESVQQTMHSRMEASGVSSGTGAPIVVILLHDEDGGLGEAIAEVWVLNERAEEEGFKRFANFMADQSLSSREKLVNRFRQLEKQRHVISASKQPVASGKIKDILSGLFDSVYPDRIPFPFDGFHTARGNAATDCHHFTTELFRGSLNQTSMAAYSPRQKNRAILVLQESWKIIMRDGSVGKRPGNPRAALIINLFEAMLNDGHRMHLGQAIRVICRPPFGCNIASAGLLLGVFVAPRREAIRLIHRGKAVAIETWLGSAFQKSFLDLAVLDETEIEYVPQEEEDEWHTLLADWESEPTYEGQLEFYKRALDRSKELSIPQGLHYRWEFLCRNAQTAQEKIDQWRKSLMDQEGYAQTGYEERNAAKLARCACEMARLRHKMNSEPVLWTEDQHAVTEDALVQLKQASLQFFPSWLPRQIEMVPMKFDRFRLHMQNAANNFRTLGFREQAEQVEERLKKVASDIERLQRIATLTDEVKAFMACHRISEGSKVKEIHDCLLSIRELEHALRDAAQSRIPVPHLNTLMEDLHGLKTKCQVQLETHKQRAAAIWNSNLRSLNDVQNTIQDVRTLMTIFDGRDGDIADFRLMIRILTKFEEHYLQMSSMALNDAQLEEKYHAALAELNEMLGEEDEIPWDIELTYNDFRREIEQLREAKAAEWMASNVPGVRSIQQLNAPEAYRLREVLRSFPPFLNANQKEQVIAATISCSLRLKELAVEGLIVQFRDLAKDAQEEFLKRAQEILSARSASVSVG